MPRIRAVREEPVHAIVVVPVELAGEHQTDGVLREFAALDQDVDDTIGQAVGSRPIPPGNLPNFDADEPAYRYGYGARLHYGEQYPSWNPDLEGQLEEEWNSLEGGDWRSRRAAIRRGWDYDV